VNEVWAVISGSLGRCPYIGQFPIMPPLYVLGPALALGALFLALQWGMTLALNSRLFRNGDRLVHFHRHRTQRPMESHCRSYSPFIGPSHDWRKQDNTRFDRCLMCEIGILRQFE
jgi:hypothetical protein